MAPTYKLIYFKSKAVGEPLRFLLSYGGIEFEDVRVDFDTEWKNVKPHTPFGQVPVLEVNGKKINQSLAIGRYLAKQVNLAGNDDWENMEIDAVVETVNDFSLKIVAYKYEPDVVRQQSLKGPLLNETIPYYLTRLEALAEKHKGHLVLGRLTWADIYFASQIDTLSFYSETDLLANYSHLHALVDKVFALPNIKEWVKKRPKTDF